MSIADPPKAGTLMTVEEFLALPDDGVARELIRGVVRERREPAMPYHNRFHAVVEATITQALWNWLDEQPEPRGQVVCGEAAFRLRGTRDSLVGIDAAYVSAEHLTATPPGAKVFDGPPVLAVEILSPSDTQEGVAEKIGLYLEAGSIVWEADPYFKRLSIHRPGHEALTLYASQELVGDPYLPGFRVPLARIFRS